jgi:hypothetical protein
MIYIADVAEWSRASDMRLSDWCCSISKVYQKCEFESRRAIYIYLLHIRIKIIHLIG